MQKFQTKRVEIEAIRWDGTPACGKALSERAGDAISFAGSCAIVPTPAGKAWCERGDWIIKDADGAFSICPDDIFRAKYEEAA